MITMHAIPDRQTDRHHGNSMTFRSNERITCYRHKKKITLWHLPRYNQVSQQHRWGSSALIKWITHWLPLSSRLPLL